MLGVLALVVKSTVTIELLGSIDIPMFATVTHGSAILMVVLGVVSYKETNYAKTNERLRKL